MRGPGLDSASCFVGTNQYGMTEKEIASVQWTLAMTNYFMSNKEKETLSVLSSFDVDLTIEESKIFFSIFTKSFICKKIPDKKHKNQPDRNWRQTGEGRCKC